MLFFWQALPRWALLLLAAIGAPTWWYHAARRHFKAIGLTETRELHKIAFRPVIVGFMTLLVVLGLIPRR